MENLVSIGIGILILYQGYKLYQKQQKLKHDIRRMKDMNIEFGSTKGIELVKKQYPDTELKHDTRTGIQENK